MSEEDDKNALDNALEQLLGKVDAYQSLRSNVNDLLKNAFFELARAKLDSSSSALKLSERSYDLSPHAATTTVLSVRTGLRVRGRHADSRSSRTVMMVL